MVNVIIGGDVCPIGKNLSYFKLGDADSIFNDLLFEIESADLSIVNLECPLIEDDTPIVKTGPVLGVDSDCINGLKQAKIDVVNLSNNHIMDHGPKGLFNTIRVCETAGIATVGAGKDIAEARNILIKEINGIKVGILGIAEHEFSIATHDRCGAYPLDFIDYVRNLRANQGNFHYLIVLLHGGNEHYPLPSPRLKDACHFLVEMGANAVIVQHTHCPGSYEEYKGSHIVYGQGNLIFDSKNPYRPFHEGFLVKLSISREGISAVNMIPFSQSLSHPGARRLEKREAIDFLEELKKRSSAITDDVFVRDQWLQFCKNKKSDYLSRIYGLNSFFSKLIYKNLFTRLFLNSNSLSRLQNTISCESHREVLETLLENDLI